MNSIFQSNWRQSIKHSFNDEQLEKQDLPIVVVDCESTTFSNKVHPSNELSSIVVTDSGIVISINDLHSLKAELLIETTDEGISILSREVHPSNEHLQIDVTD